MKNKTYVVPYRMGSASAKALAEALGTVRLNKTACKRLVGGPHKSLVNWGNSSIDNQEMRKCRIINSPEAVRRASNKLTFFRLMKDTGCVPQFFETLDDVKEAFANGVKTVFARTTLTGHSGDGIVVMEYDDPTTWCNAPLYTVYVPKKDEYRVHISQIDKTKEPEVFFIQRKAMIKGFADPNFKVRNLSNGFIYANKEIDAPASVTEVALKCFKAGLDLDFGAFDVIYNEKNDQALVLEVNTAPGLAGTTLEKYKAMLS